MVRKFSLTIATALLAGAAPAADRFADQTPPPPPDYSQPTSWAARPGAEGAAATVPVGATPAPRAPVVDVFYVNPTTYVSKTRWNQDVADRAANAVTDASVISRQASVFNGCCRVFAPRYRQGSSLSFIDFAGDGSKAFDLAYTDVVRAFDHYLKIDNHGRPFILAGHSQGAYHIARLIEERIDGTPLARRMVAAYPIGYNLSEGDFGRTYKNVRPCAKPRQTGCVVQWNAVLNGTDLAARAKAGEQRFVDRYPGAPGQRMLCVNPLTFDRDRPAAPRSVSRGSIPGDPNAGPFQPLRVRSVAARCDNGLLVVEPDAALGLKPLPGGSMHYHDYSLFYAELRADAIRRASAFLSSKR